MSQIEQIGRIDEETIDVIGHDVGRHAYIFIYHPNRRLELMRILTDLAKNPRNNFTMKDANIVARRVWWGWKGKLISNALKKKLSSKLLFPN